MSLRLRIGRATTVEVGVADVTISYDGVSGNGEATPAAHYGETVATTTAFLDRAVSLLGNDPFALERIGAALAELPGERAAKAAIDAPLHDLCGKLVGLPVWRLLGVPRAGPPTT